MMISTSSGAARGRRRVKRPIRLLLIVIATIAAGYCAVCTAVLIASRQGVWERAGETGASLVAAIESHVARNIEIVDASLQGVVENLHDPGIDAVDPQLRQLILFDRSVTAQDLGTIMVLDREGNLRFDSRTTDVRQQNLADRDYFKMHEASADSGLFISKPLLARVTGQWFIALSRRISNEDGSFAGVAVASLRLSYFEKLFERVWLKNNSNITLASLDGTVIMRWPYQSSYIGLDIGHAEIYKQLAHARSGRFQTVSQTDGEDRLVAYSQIGNLPLVIGVGQTTAFIYNNWFKYALLVIATMVALTGITLLLALYLRRELRRRLNAEAELATLAMTDGLTGLSNHRHFAETLEREWRRAARNRQLLSLMMIDTDFFKNYNDNNGHLTGDAVLKAIGTAIADCINRGSDFGARYGGDEFALLLAGTSVEGAQKIAEKIRERLADICRERGIEPVGLSIGIASAMAEGSRSYADLLRGADEAMYDAKKLGRNRTEVKTVAENSAPRAQAA